MKTLATIVVTSALLVSAAAANAGEFERSETNTITTETTSSRAQAYQLGVSKLSALKAASPRQLTNEIRVYTPDIVEETVRLEDDAYITVQERMDANGKLGYVGLVNIELRYTEIDD